MFFFISGVLTATVIGIGLIVIDQIVIGLIVIGQIGRIGMAAAAAAASANRLHGRRRKNGAPRLPSGTRANKRRPRRRSVFPAMKVAAHGGVIKLQFCMVKTIS